MRGSASLEKRLGYTFVHPALLEEALTHVSAGSREHCYQRLEFLGDRVLGLVVSTMLFEAFPGAPEGELSKRLADLVRKETCADVAREVGLGEVLKLGRGEMLTGGRRKEALLGDAMEAVIAAVYQDAGFGAAQALVLRLWGRRIAAVEPDARDPKSLLQEWAQARGMPPPVYEEAGRSGADHALVFTIRVTLENGAAAEATARPKRLAEQTAARMLLERMEAGDD